MSRRPVLVDGCFDPFHPGHLAYLRAARVLANDDPVLCVVATDDTVRAKHEPLLSQSDRAELVRTFVDAVIVTGDPVPTVIRSVKPRAYVKGPDWRDRLPDDHVWACDAVGCEIHYTDTAWGSSSNLLTTWQQATDQRFLRSFEQIAAEQVQPVFDDTYWTRQGFTYKQRVEIEGDHPHLLLKTFPDKTFLDWGAGQGHFAHMLKVLGANVMAYDPSIGLSTSIDVVPILPSGLSRDVVVCREVFEHVPIRSYEKLVESIIAASAQFVYVTARFHENPEHLLDVQTSDDLDYTHISRVNQAWLRSLFVAHGMKRREDLETAMDHQKKGRCLVYEHGH